MPPKQTVDFDFEFTGAQQWNEYARKQAEGSTSKNQYAPLASQDGVTDSPPLISGFTPSDVSSPPSPDTSSPVPTPSADNGPVPSASGDNNVPAYRQVYSYNRARMDQQGHHYTYPNVREMNRRRYNDIGPEELIMNNEAFQRNREGEPPDDSYNFSMFFPDGFKRRFYGQRDINLAHIAVKTNTYIAPSPYDIHIVEIWGAPGDIAEAKVDLYALGKFSLDTVKIEDKKKKKENEKKKFDKVRAAPTEIEAARNAKFEQLKEKELYFKQVPDINEFPVVGVFSWPVQDTNPQDVLGMNLETLDQIRTIHECYIAYVRKSQAIYVYGMKPGDVQTAIDRIYGVLCESAAKVRCLGPTTSRYHIIVPPTSDQLMSDVFLDLNHNLRNRQITVKRNNVGVQCRLYGRKPTQLVIQEWEKKRPGLLKANTVFLRAVVQRGLEDTLFLRTQVHMKVNFGQLVLFGYKKTSDDSHTHDIHTFMDMMRSKDLQSELVRYIGPESVAQELISICRIRNEIFTPLYTISPTVPDRPERLYSATFELRLSDDKASTEMRFECEFGPEEIIENKRCHRIKSGSWLSIPRHGSQYNNKVQTDNEGAYKRKGPLDIKVMDLGRNMAWQLEISSYSRLKDPDQWNIFNDFVKYVRLQVPYPTAEDRGTEPVPQMHFTNLHGLKVESVVVKSKFQWFISMTPYIFEVVKYDFYPTPLHTPEGVSASVRGIPPDSRWAVNLTSRDWLDKLGTQWDLPLGRPGRWNPSIAAFFKPTNVGGIDDPLVNGVPKPRKEWVEDGFAEFQGRVVECMELIAKAKKNARQRADMARKGVHEDDMD